MRHVSTHIRRCFASPSRRARLLRHAPRAPVALVPLGTHRFMQLILTTGPHNSHRLTRFRDTATAFPFPLQFPSAPWRAQVQACSHTPSPTRSPLPATVTSAAAPKLFRDPGGRGLPPLPGMSAAVMWPQVVYHIALR